MILWPLQPFTAPRIVSIALLCDSENRKFMVAFTAVMSSILDHKSSLDFRLDWQEPPPGRDTESFNLDRRKSQHRERESSSTTFIKSESIYVWSFRQALLVACVTVFLISICSYDPSHARPASQSFFSSVCFPTVSRFIVTVHQFTNF